MTGRPDERQPPRIAGELSPEAGLTDMIRHGHAQVSPLAGTIRAGETAADTDGGDTWRIDQGADVLCEDGEKIGEVVDVMPGYLVIEQGFFDPKDLYVPLRLVSGHDETSLTLSVTREAFDSEDWSEEPEVDGAGDQDAPPG